MPVLNTNFLPDVKHLLSPIELDWIHAWAGLVTPFMRFGADALQHTCVSAADRNGAYLMNSSSIPRELVYNPESLALMQHLGLDISDARLQS